MAGRISESTLREIRERADLVEVVSDAVRLTRSGASFRGLCPFHREKTPSFFVHPAKQVFHCFGCGEGGTVIDFLMKTRNLSFADAAEELGDRYGIPVRYEGQASRRRPSEDLYGALRTAAETFRDLLRSSPGARQAREFLNRRGVSAEAQQEFFLGFGGGGKDLSGALSRAGVPAETAERAGLLLRRKDGGTGERFRGRLVFPVSDARGRICGFGARALDDSVPKYLNSPETPVYRKSGLLYGLPQALLPIRREQKVVVVEGYMDLIGLWQRGIRNVVATCGTSLAEAHARALKRLSETVILFFDGDVAGKRSAVRAGEPLYSAGVSPLVLFPPKGMDPDDWARECPGEEIADRIGKAAPLMEFVERACARKFDLGQIQGKLSYLRTMGRYLPWISDPAEKRLYVRRVAETAGVPEDTVLERRDRRRPEPGDARAANAGGKPPSGIAPEEGMLLGLLCRDPSLFGDAERDGVEGLVADPGIREAVGVLLRKGGRGDSPEVAAALDGAAGPDARRRLAEQILRGEGGGPEPRKAYREVVAALRIRSKRRELSALREEIARSPEERARELLLRMVAARAELERLERERAAL